MAQANHVEELQYSYVNLLLQTTVNDQPLQCTCSGVYHSMQHGSNSYELDV